MNAKEMFEALGYRKYSIETSGLIIGWQANPKDYNVSHEYRNIQFYTDKTWNIFADGITQALVFSKPTVAEFEAITQQMKELGWIK